MRRRAQRPTRRAVSEIISALLLIMITVAAAVMLYAYTSGLMGRLAVGPSQQPYLEQLTLDYYDWTTLNSLRLTVRNVGLGKVTLVDFFISGTRNTTALTFGSACNSPNGVLSVQAPPCLITFPKPSSLTLTPGVAYTVKLVSKNGAVFTFSCIAGRST